MSQKLQDTALDEPVGIVISRGSREEAAPRFRAYFWNEDQESTETVASEYRAA